MADAAGTTGTVLKTAAPALNAVPYVGPILSMAATIGGGALEQSAAKRQAEQAARERENALRTGKQALRPEFANKLRADQMAALAGMPGYNEALSNIQSNTSNQVRTIMESSPSGSAALGAISAALGQENAATNTLGAENASYKASLGKDARNTLWNVGLQQRNLEDIRDAQRNQGLQSAAALENAATYNKQNGANKIIGAISSTASGLSNAYVNNQNQQQYLDLLKMAYSSGVNPNATTTTNPNVTAPQVGVGAQQIAVQPNSFWNTTSNNNYAAPQTYNWAMQ